MADRICIIRNSRIAQCDTPENILKYPVNVYVTEFIGANRLRANPDCIRASDIMRRQPVTITKGRTVLQALQIIRQGRVDSLLMVDSTNHLLGILGIIDLMGVGDSSGLIDQYLSDDYIAVEENTTL